MEVDYFRDLVVPVIGGLGIFMLGLEFMSDGIQNLAVNRMRALLAKIAGTPLKGVLAGTVITGVLQSSTAMTVMVVGLVNSGVLNLRSAISVIMGANIGTTLGNGLIALPLGPLGLFLAGAFALIYVFAKSARTKNIALACMGFALIFYGLNLMTGGLRPLRNLPEVMVAISSLSADSFLGLLSCVGIAALITALIHSSSATIGIVMGLGSAGILSWDTAVAFSLGADLGTTITSWLASLSLSKNAKRTAYAHISFNVIGVLVMLPLFFPSMKLLSWAMQFFGGDPSVPVMTNGEETFPLVPVAVGLYSTAFNIFNTVLLFPFVGTFERVLSRVGHTSDDEREDYSIPRYLDAAASADLSRGVEQVDRELARQVEGVSVFLSIARDHDGVPEAKQHQTSLDILGCDIRRYTATMFRPGLPPREADLLASLIEEADLAASLSETLYQIAHRVEEKELTAPGQRLVDATLDQIGKALAMLTSPAATPDPDETKHQEAFLATTREQCLRLEIGSEERGALLELLGSARRAFFLIDLVEVERASLVRVAPAVLVPTAPPPAGPVGLEGASAS